MISNFESNLYRNNYGYHINIIVLTTPIKECIKFQALTVGSMPARLKEIPII